MKKKIEFVSSSGSGNRITLYNQTAYRPDEVAISIVTSEGEGKGVHINGPALRDALLEAFPLEKPVKQYGSGVKPSVVPGMVFGDAGCKPYVILPNGRYWDTLLKEDFAGGSVDWHEQYLLIFDPRDAVALPSPLGIRVGDTVRRTKTRDSYNASVTTVVEFKVNHIDGETGYICAKYGPGFNPKGFEVTSREVPDRLPAGTIVREKRNGVLRLVTTEGHINLKDGFEVPRGNGPTNDVKAGVFEVIYLPES